MATEKPPLTNEQKRRLAEIAQPTMGKHGRLHEEEAARDKSVMFGEPHLPVHVHGAVPERAPKPVEKKPAPKARPDITQRMDALRSALSDKYPHNDVQVIPEGLKVAVPTGHITIESEKVAACADNAAIRAYIDSLPVQ